MNIKDRVVSICDTINERYGEGMNIREIQSITVCGLRYRVVLDEKFFKSENDAGNDHRGTVNHGDCVVYLNPMFDNQQLRITLMHEILHIIEVELSVDLKEHDINRLASGLSQALTENGLWTIS